MTPAFASPRQSTPPAALRALLLLALIFSGAMFGFFYAWTCSTLWGLDQLPPEVAIQAMQAMNASVRNGVFGLGFFGTPLVLGLGLIAAYLAGARSSAFAMAAALLAYIGGVIALTGSVNVPMNTALAQVSLAQPQAALAQIWQGYSAPWQAANQMRTLGSGLSLALVGAALALLGRRG
jgi:uncharacterized membrane protein